MAYDPRMYQPVFVDWFVSKDPVLTPGIEYLCIKASKVTLFIITPIEYGWPFCKKHFKYHLRSPLIHYIEMKKIGAVFDTMEEAKAKAMVLTYFILRGDPSKDPVEDYSI